MRSNMLEIRIKLGGNVVDKTTFRDNLENIYDDSHAQLDREEA